MLLILICSLSFQGIVCVNQVRIKGPEYVKRGEDMIFNCSSQKAPIGQSAEFLVNDETYTNIRVQDKECFSGLGHFKCLPDECNCSEEGKWYMIQMPSYEAVKNVKIGCTMKFTSQKVSNSIIVTKLDLSGPFITVPDKLPLVVGSRSKLTCSVNTSLPNVSLMWNCFNKSPNLQTSMPSMYSTVLNFIIVAEYEGSECSCTVKWKRFSSKTSVTITVSYSPSLEVVKEQQCNKSKTSHAHLVCILHGDVSMYGFIAWKHFFKRQYIRDLDGEVMVNKSTLIIPCSNQNSGEYICIAWNDHLNKRYWSNKSTIIEVQEPPLLFSSNTVKISDRFLLTVQFLTSCKLFKVEWYKNNEVLINSTNYIMNILNANITVDIHLNQIITQGYLASLCINNHLRGSYTVVVQNEKGQSMRNFIIKTDKHVFTIWTLLWITGGIIAIILTVLITIVLMKRAAYINADRSLSLNRAPNAIYYAAPTTDSITPIYDTTESMYIDPIHDGPRQTMSQIDPTQKESDRLSLNIGSDEIMPHYIEII